jgi:uncharacterized protein (TIGR02001 family)
MHYILIDYLRGLIMKKSLLTFAVLSTLSSSLVLAAEEAPKAEAKPSYEISYNVGLFSQYIWRGLSQTDNKPALQGGVDFTHDSGFYLGAWASNVSWPRDKWGESAAAGDTYYESGGSLEIDLYGGYKTEIAKSGVTLDVGALTYYYPGRKTSSAWAKINTTELYAALSYGWLQGKYSQVVSDDAWGFGTYKSDGEKLGSKADGTYYAELNLNVPVDELIKSPYMKGVSALAHVGRLDFSGKDNEFANFTDYKLGLQKSFDNGVNVGGYWTKTNAADSAWTYDGQNVGRSLGTLFVQKTF